MESAFRADLLVLATTAMMTFVLAACDSTVERRPAPKGGGTNTSDAGQGMSETDAGGGSMGTPDAGQGMMPSGLAALAPKSDGECPSFGSSAPVSFSSSGVTRRVAVIAPAARPTNMPIVFLWHGLTTLDQQPVESVISGFGLASLAEQKSMIFVVAEALEQDIPFVGKIALWGILGEASQDLTMFDDLRTCISEEYSADLSRVYSWGHSGGALWTSMLLLERSDSLAAAVEFSGGSDFSIIGLGGPFITYQTPASKTPILFSTGGMNDVWPEQFPLIRFEETTDSLQTSLLQDGHTVVRCRHDLGHFQLPSESWSVSIDWFENHSFGVPSSFVADGRLANYSSWCEVGQ